MYLIFVTITWAIIGLKIISWKDSYKYYSTVLYYCVMNLLFDFLYYNHTLFAYKGASKYLNHTIISVTFCFVIMPIAVVIFLQRFPTQRGKRGLYMLSWASLFLILEYIFFRKGMFIYGNGWNLLHSFWFNIMMFTLLILHYKRPLLTLALSLLCIIVFIFLFPIPFSSLK